MSRIISASSILILLLSSVAYSMIYTPPPIGCNIIPVPYGYYVQPQPVISPQPLFYCPSCSYASPIHYQKTLFQEQPYRHKKSHATRKPLRQSPVYTRDQWTSIAAHASQQAKKKESRKPHLPCKEGPVDIIKPLTQLQLFRYHCAMYPCDNKNQQNSN